MLSMASPNEVSYIHMYCRDGKSWLHVTAVNERFLSTDNTCLQYTGAQLSHQLLYHASLQPPPTRLICISILITYIQYIGIWDASLYLYTILASMRNWIPIKMFPPYTFSIRVCSRDDQSSIYHPAIDKHRYAFFFCRSCVHVRALLPIASCGNVSVFILAFFFRLAHTVIFVARVFFIILIFLWLFACLHIYVYGRMKDK